MNAPAKLRLSSIETGRHIDMEQFDFTLGFSVMASDELDARVKLKDLLKAISKEEILWAMKLVEKDEA